MQPEVAISIHMGQHAITKPAGSHNVNSQHKTTIRGWTIHGKAARERVVRY
jgi:hypothetical protein